MPNQERIYIGNVVLDESNQEILKKWLLDIIKNLQGHGNGFNADTVDGFHATAFATAEQGLKADTALQSGIHIGSSEIINTTGTQYIKTDGVLIDSIVYNALKGLTFLSIEDEMVLSNFLVEIVRKLNNKIVTLDQKKVDKQPGKDLSSNDFTDEYKSMLDELDIAYTEVVCPKNAAPSQQVTRRVLNAGSVNHLQFILTTESLYAQYSEAVKKSWKNVFIFVDEEDFPSDYEVPFDCPIETGYDFRIDDERPGETWLQYKGRQATKWLDLVQINQLYSKFLEYTDFEGIMRDIATTIVEAAIGEIDTPEHINALIKRIDAPGIDHWQDYPFLSSELDFVYDVIQDGNSLCSKNQQGFLIADVSNITDSIEDELNSIKSNYNTLLSNVNSNTQKVNTLNQYVKKTDINSSITNSTNPVSSSAIKSSIDSLSSQISSLQSSIQSLNQNINDMKYFQKYIVLGVGQYNGVVASQQKWPTPTGQIHDPLGAYDLTLDSNGNPKEARLSVTNRGNITKADGTYKYDNPDYICARIIQQHTGKSATDFSNPYIYFQINGVAYARKINEGTDYAKLNIRLPPGPHQINVMYVDTSQEYSMPLYASQQVYVEKIY